MPECLNCGSSFPNKKEIDGKVRVLNSRKYCLTCSPFGEHNTKQIHKDESQTSDGTECVCDECGRKYTYYRDKGHQLDKCNSCIQMRKRHRYKKRLTELLGGECNECGYSGCLTALDFHHTDPDEKEFNVSKAAVNRSWESLKEEAKKCILLCANCHRKKHCGMCE